jgi:hypothetical protein
MDNDSLTKLLEAIKALSKAGEAQISALQNMVAAAKRAGASVELGAKAKTPEERKKVFPKIVAMVDDLEKQSQAASKLGTPTEVSQKWVRSAQATAVKDMKAAH